MYFDMVVIGGGMVGRTAALFLDCPILERQPYYHKVTFGGLHYLHLNPSMDVLFERLGIRPDIIEIKGGAVTEVTSHVLFADMTSGEKEEVISRYVKKIGRGNGIEDLREEEKRLIMDGMFMQDIQEGYSISFNELYDLLVEKTSRKTIHQIKIETIFPGNRIIAAKLFTQPDVLLQIKYGKAVLTIPATSLMRTHANVAVEESSYVFVCSCTNNPYQKFDYLYLVDGNVKATRLTVRPMNIVHLESPSPEIEDATKDMMKLGFRQFHILEMVENKFKRITGDPTETLELLEQGECYPIGRYARWDNRLTYNHAFNQVMELVDEFKKA